MYRLGQVALSQDVVVDESTEYELINTAKQTDPRYDNEEGFFQYSVDELREMARNFNNGVAGIEIAVDLNHDPEKLAYAWIKPGSMYVAPSRKMAGEYSLYAQLHRFTSTGRQMVAEGTVRYFSLQIRNNVKRWINNTKQTFNNVIYGLAFTNIPVIKGLSPTFSEQEKNINKKIMDKFVQFLSELEAKKQAPSSDEREQLIKDFAALSSEDQTSLGDRVYAVIDIEEVETPEETPAEAQEVEVAEQAEQAAPEASAGENEGESQEETSEASEPAAEKAPEETPAPEVEEAQVSAPSVPAEVTASEVNYAERLASVEKQLSDALSQNKQLLEQQRDVKLGEVADGLVLSKDRKVGFTPAVKTNLVAFMRSLSDEQVASFQKIFSEIKSVDLGVHGSAAGAPKALTDSEKVATANAKAKELMSADKSLSETMAVEKAYRELGLI